jgi:hypothetical protein
MIYKQLSLEPRGNNSCALLLQTQNIPMQENKNNNLTFFISFIQ